MDDIKKTIAEMRKVTGDGDVDSGSMALYADLLEKTAADRDYMVINAAGLHRTAEALVAERDALRDQIDTLIENSVRVEGGPVPWVEIDAEMWDRILSRAIDTKEKSNEP